jgi:uncharacterized pyridoxal phosphate-containing UPF0001 family protein
VSAALPTPQELSGLRQRVERGVAETRRRIESAGGDPDAVEIVAVTKGFGVVAPMAAAAAGLVSIGENYAAELLEKAEALARSADEADRRVVWHYIGSVQRRKVRSLAPVVGVWQSLWRLAEGEEVARRAPGAVVLVEVEATGLPGRQGVAVRDAAALVAALSALDLSVRGLMTVAAPGAGKEALEVFHTVSELADELALPIRSMGMSGDLEQAVRAGTTMVRLGSALFGPRPAARRLAQ